MNLLTATLSGLLILIIGCLESVEWNAEMEHWNGYWNDSIDTNVNCIQYHPPSSRYKSQIMHQLHKVIYSIPLVP